MKGRFLGQREQNSSPHPTEVELFSIHTGLCIHLFCPGMRKLTLEYSSWILLGDLIGKYLSLNSIDKDFQFYVK